MSSVAYGPAMESGLWAGKPRGEVLRALCNAADDDKWECYPSYEFTAFIAGAGRSTTHREIRALEYCGLVKVIEGGGGRWQTNRYWVNVTFLELCRDRVRAAKKSAGKSGPERIKAMKAARDECQRWFGIVERMMRRIAAGKASDEVKAKAVSLAFEIIEDWLRNRPRHGRFQDPQNRPAQDQNRPAGDTETVHGVDPKRHRNVINKKTRARGGAAPDGSPPRSGGESRADGPRHGDLNSAEKEKPKRPPTERERLLGYHRLVILDWLTCHSPYPEILRSAGIEERLWKDDAEAAVLRLDPVALNAMRGQVRWAHRCHHADPAVRDPKDHVPALMKAFADGENRTVTQLRCAKLMGAPFSIDQRPDDFGEVWKPGRDDGAGASDGGQEPSAARQGQGPARSADGDQPSSRGDSAKTGEAA